LDSMAQLNVKLLFPSFKSQNLFFLKTIVIPVVILLLWSPVLSAADDVLFFSIQGLKLNMHLDEVIKSYRINNVKSSKDKYGLVHGYEIVKTKKDMKLVLNFTGNKRLYRIDFSNQYSEFKKNSRGIYALLAKKYGDAAITNIDGAGGDNRNIMACWGFTCNKFSPSTPALKANIDYYSGKLKLTLIDNRIFNKDWEKYKRAFNQKKSGKRTLQNPANKNPDF
jgi:hypothetical protein